MTKRKDQIEVTREEAKLAASLREAGQEIADRAKTMLIATREGVDILAPKIAEVLRSVDESDDNDLTAPGSFEKVERAVGLLNKISQIAKSSAETAEKIIRMERHVRGDPTELITVQSPLAIPETNDQLREELRLELAALERSKSRSN